MSLTLDSTTLASLRRFQVTKYFYSIATSVLVYDHLLTLGREVTLVWPEKWGVGKMLFFLARYLPYVDLAVIFSGLSAKQPSEEWCRAISRTTGWLNLVGISIAEFILVMRTWALWNRNPYIIIGLMVLGIMALALCSLVSMKLSPAAQFTPISDLSPELSGCFVSGRNRLVYLDFLTLLVYETIIVILTLIIGFRHYRQGFHHSSFVKSFFKDGILYYLYLFIFSLANLIIPITSPRESIQFLVELQRVMHTICAVHILLHLRQRTGKLHPSYTITRSTTETGIASSDIILDTVNDCVGVETRPTAETNDVWANQVCSGDMDWGPNSRAIEMAPQESVPPSI